MVLSYSASSTPILLAEFAPAAEPREHWPAHLASARASGATAIAAVVPWGYSAAAIVDLAQLSMRLGLALAIDLRCLLAPPADLLRAHPAALVRDSSGQPLLTESGDLHVDPLHPALRDATHVWLADLVSALNVALVESVRCVGFICDISEMLAKTLQDWQHAEAWSVALLGLPLVLGSEPGWPFMQAPLRIARPASPSVYQRAMALLIQLVGSDLYAAEIPETVDDMQVAWADAPGVAVQVRHTPMASYLSIERQTSEPYSGVLTYRNAAGELLHLHANIGPSRCGIVLLRDEEIIGAAFDGDASEGVWLSRAMQSSVVFNGGSGAIVPYGSGMMLLAAQSGRFQIRRPHAWDKLHAYRLLTSGTLIAVSSQIEATHLTVPYTAADAAGITDLYILSTDPAELGEPLRSMLAARLHARAELLRSTQLAQLALPAQELQSCAVSLDTIHAYQSAWDTQHAVSAQVRMSVQQHSSRLRATRTLEGDAPASEEEQRLAQILAIL